MHLNTALREFFRAKLCGVSFDYLSGDLTSDIGSTHRAKEEIKLEIYSGGAKNKNENCVEELPPCSPLRWDMAESFLQLREDTTEELQYLSPKSWGMAESFLQNSDVADEFFDVSAGYEFDKQYHSSKSWNMAESFFQNSDAADEFFDVSAEYEFDLSKVTKSSNEDLQSQVNASYELKQ